MLESILLSLIASPPLIPRIFFTGSLINTAPNNNNIGVELGILFLVDLDRIKRDPTLLGKVLARARYGRLGSLTIYLVTNGRELREWAESLREGLAKNFDVTVYLYPVANVEKAVKMIISSCRSDDIVTIYREIPGHYAKEISSSCPHVEIT